MTFKYIDTFLHKILEGTHARRDLCFISFINTSRHMDLRARGVQVGEEKVGILRCFFLVRDMTPGSRCVFLSLSLLLGGLSFLNIVLTDQKLAI